MIFSLRFQQVHEARSRKQPAHSVQPAGKARRPQSGASRALHRVSARMDIDQVDRRPVGSSRGGRRNIIHAGPSARGGAAGRGRDGRRGRGRGSRGGSLARGGNTKKAPLNKDNLDMDLDSYMMADTQAGRSILDQDLDNYMQGSPAV